MKSICLNMIVKNEKPVIERCLQSVKGIIDYWVIVDTGSTDGTQDAIRSIFQNTPGELHERPWINFEHNRNIALDLARNKSDYILFIDADEILEFTGPLDKSQLNGDFYFAFRTGQKVECQFILLINNDSGWKWHDVVHEYVTNSHPVYGNILHQVSVNCGMKDGHRSQDPEKSLKDAFMLEEALKFDPENTRYVFYLAQSYANARNHLLALTNYRKRASMGGYEDEVFWSLYCSAALEQNLQKDAETIIKSFCKAHAFNPSRAEPLYALASFFQSIGLLFLAYLIIKEAITIEIPQKSMKIQKWIYEYGALLLFAELSLMIGHVEEAQNAYRQLLSKKECPESIKKQIESLS